MLVSYHNLSYFSLCFADYLVEFWSTFGCGVCDNSEGLDIIVGRDELRGNVAIALETIFGWGVFDSDDIFAVPGVTGNTVVLDILVWAVAIVGWDVLFKMVEFIAIL